MFRSHEWVTYLGVLTTAFSLLVGGRAQAAGDDPEPKWVVRQTPAARTALVFVPGLTGDMTGTWTAPNGKTFWGLVNENEELAGKLDAFVFGFPSYLFKSGSFDIDQAANRLHQRLLYSRVLDYPNVVFVAHSMGGLVVLRELLTHREVLDKVPAVVFYATPMEGSLVADIGKWFSPNTAISQMTEADANAILRMIDSDWKSIPDSHRPHVRCAYENKPVGPITVVRWASATRYCEGATPAIEGTHMTIVKPDHPSADAIVILANTLNEFVLGHGQEAQLETPDFTPDGNGYSFVLKDSFGRQPARLINDGGHPLRFTFAEISDPALWLTPDDTPRDIPQHDRINMTVGLGRGATKSEYHFLLRTAIRGDMLIRIHVPDMAAIYRQQDDSAVKVANAIDGSLTDTLYSREDFFSLLDEKTAPETIVKIAHEQLSRENPDLSEATRWILTADLLNALNWPELAARALRHAEQASPSIVQSPHVKRLSGWVAFQSGNEHIFAGAETPRIDAMEANDGRPHQPLASPATLLLGHRIASLMIGRPGLREFGWSLKGDLELFTRHFNAAKRSYERAAEQHPSPSIAARIFRVESEHIEDSQQRLAELEARQTELGAVVTLSDGLFDTGKSTLKPGAMQIFNRLSAFLTHFPQTRVLIEGHTDNRGGDDYNSGLSERRARAVAAELESRGALPDQIQILGRGSSMPVATNSTPEGRQQNRRVEIIFSDASGQFAEDPGGRKP